MDSKTRANYKVSRQLVKSASQRFENISKKYIEYGEKLYCLAHKELEAYDHCNYWIYELYRASYHGRHQDFLAKLEDAESKTIELLRGTDLDKTERDIFNDFLHWIRRCSKLLGAEPSVESCLEEVLLIMEELVASIATTYKIL